MKHQQQNTETMKTINEMDLNELSENIDNFSMQEIADLNESDKSKMRPGGVVHALFLIKAKSGDQANLRDDLIDELKHFWIPIPFSGSLARGVVETVIETKKMTAKQHAVLRKAYHNSSKSPISGIKNHELKY